MKGFFYGIAGTLAYGMYYFSVVTGTHIVDSLRFKHGFSNIQAFMRTKFGRVGEHFYNAVISFRLVSEVFSNLLVFGFITTLFLNFNETYLILLIAVATLMYSSVGGLHTALKVALARFSNKTRGINEQVFNIAIGYLCYVKTMKINRENITIYHSMFNTP